MAYLLFVDESGIDHSESPYDILAGICVKDINLWSLIQEIKKIKKIYLAIIIVQDKSS